MIELSEQEKYMLWHWEDGEIGNLRNFSTESGKKFKTLLERIPNFSGTVYRGLTVIETSPIVTKEKIKIKLVSSCSKEKQIALDFINYRKQRSDSKQTGVLLEIKCKTGKFLDEVNLPRPKNEESALELLLLPGTILKLVKNLGSNEEKLKKSFFDNENKSIKFLHLVFEEI